MSPRTDVTDAPAVTGVYPKLGNLVTRRPIVVIGLWIVLAAVFSLAIPPLAVVIGQKQAAIMPDDAPVMVATRDMVAAFHDKGTDNVVLVVLTDDKGLRPADENTYSHAAPAIHGGHPYCTIAELAAPSAAIKSFVPAISTCKPMVLGSHAPQ